MERRFSCSKCSRSESTTFCMHQRRGNKEDGHLTKRNILKYLSTRDTNFEGFHYDNCKCLCNGHRDHRIKCKEDPTQLMKSISSQKCSEWNRTTDQAEEKLDVWAWAFARSLWRQMSLYRRWHPQWRAYSPLKARLESAIGKSWMIAAAWRLKWQE